MTDATFSTRFYASVRDYLGRIEEVMKEEDLVAVQKIVHKMLGLCQLFGTPEQIALCKALEKADNLLHLQQTLPQFYALINNSEIK